MRLRTKGIGESLNELQSTSDRFESWMWFHAASYGEFEQVRSVIGALKASSPQIGICVSFTSPSGYERLHTSQDADAYVYIPVDSTRAANSFLKTIKPKIAVFSRYDIWFNHARWCKQHNVPTVLVSATLPENLHSRPVARAWKKLCLTYIDVVFTAGDTELHKFQQLQASPTLIPSRDPRVDRILERVDDARTRAVYANLFPRNSRFSHSVVIGSSWPKEEELVKRVSELDAFASLRWIIVPHEPTPQHVSDLQHQFPTSKLLSELEDAREEAAETRIVIVDSVGKLLDLYSCATAVIVGGGFGKGVHSVLEPAGYAVPLSCGPAIERARDAQNLRDLGALTVVHTVQDVEHWLKSIVLEPGRYGISVEACNKYMHDQSGATTAIVAHLSTMVS